MKPTLRRSFALLSALVAASSIPLARDTCDATSHCHFTRWLPEETGTAVWLHNTGEAVELNGDWAASSAPGGDRVLIYRRDGATWSQVQVVEDPHGENNGFGLAMAMRGEFLAVGAPDDDTLGFQSGAVHVYRLIGDTWTFDQTLLDATPTDNAGFGRSVGLDGPWLAVGASFDSAEGHVHVFLRTVFEWEILYEISDGAGGNFGSAVAVREYEEELAAHVFIGDPSSDVAALAGGAVAHARVEVGGYTLTAPVAPVELDGFDRFGSDLDFDGNVLVVASQGDDDFGENAGAAYVFEVEPGVAVPTIDYVSKLLPCGADPVPDFAESVAVHAGRVAVGSPWMDSAGQFGGAVHLFEPAPLGGGWDRVDVIRPADGVVDDEFGRDVALQGELVLAGARGVDEAGTLGGATYLISTANDREGGACPCDALAATESYGFGKPGAVGVPELSAGEFIPAEQTVLKLDNCLVGVAPLLMWGTVPAAIPMDAGTLWIADPRLVSMPVVGPIGQVGVGIQVPDLPVLCGFDVYFQALFLDPGAAGEYHTAQTAGLRATIGY